jgi:uncharacterized protein
MKIMQNWGRFWAIDADGYIVNDARRDYIVAPFAAPVHAMVTAYQQQLGAQLHSVYVRGTIPRGLAIPRVADLDIFALVYADPDMLDRAPLATAAATILAQHAVITDLRPEVLPLSVVADVRYFNEIMLQIQTQSVCVAGQDLAPHLPRFRPDVIVANNDVVQIEPDIDEALAALHADESPDNVRFWCRRICKNMLRAGFGLVMLDAHAFTRDLVPCYRTFATWFPEQAPYMLHALELAIEPPAEQRQVVPFLEDFGAWLIGAADTWLARHNPARVLALPLE